MLAIIAVVKNTPILFIFNAPLDSGCDYVTQTIRLVAKKRPTYGIALGDIISFPKWLASHDKWVAKRVYGCLMVRPISLFPGVRYRLLRILTYGAWSILMRTFIYVRHPGASKTLWFFEPFHMPNLLSVFAKYEKIYDCVDYYPGFNESAKSEHTQAMKRATYVFANSTPLAEQLRTIRPDTHLVPLGFAHGLFRHASKPQSQHKRGMTVGFVGSISARIDFTLLAQVAQRLPDVHFEMTGPFEPYVYGHSDHAHAAFKRLLEIKNVFWKKFVPKTQIPKIISTYDLCIIPYRIESLFNRYSFPMKTLEYFASKKPVIATDIRSLRPYHDCGLLSIVHNATQFVALIRRVQKYGWSKEKQEQQLVIARKQSWEQKIRKIQAILEGSGSALEK